MCYQKILKCESSSGVSAQDVPIDLTDDSPPKQDAPSVRHDFCDLSELDTKPVSANLHHQYRHQAYRDESLSSHGPELSRPREGDNATGKQFLSFSRCSSNFLGTSKRVWTYFKICMATRSVWQFHCLDVHSTICSELLTAWNVSQSNWTRAKKKS